MNLRRATLPAVALAAALVVSACGSAAPAGRGPGTGGASASGKVTVVASTDVYGSIVSAVGGDAVEVTSIIDSPDADPHEYETTPSDAVAFNSAKLVVFNGADYDPFADKLIAAAGTKPATINVAELSGLQAAVPAGEEFNEHVAYSLPTVKKLADAVAGDLATSDAASGSRFIGNATAFDAKVDGLIAKLDAIRAAHSGEKVAITEPVPLYIIQAAGLENATPPEFSEAVEGGTDAPAAVVAQMLALFQGPDAVKVLLANTQTEDAATRQVADAATTGNVPIVQVTETLPAGVPDYVTWMGQLIDALAAAFDK